MVISLRKWLFGILTKIKPRKNCMAHGSITSGRSCALALYEPLSHLFSLTLSQHYLPAQWCMHLITPIHKSGDKTTVKNYRPISLLCIVSKVLERIIYDKIIGYYKINFEFPIWIPPKALHPTVTFGVSNKCLHCLNDKTQTDVVYLDFRKAFDSVPHNQLLSKLRTTGISGNLWRWFKAYLSSRTQCVSINNQRSHFLPVLSGVPHARKHLGSPTLPHLYK